jgi:hypothetical protein
MQLGMVVHTCNPALRRMSEEILEFKASLGCSKTPCERRTGQERGERGEG